MSILVDEFGRLNQEDVVSRLRLINKHGMEVRIITFGAAITHIIVQDKKNERVDVVLGYDRLTDYIEGKDAMGAVVGRHANRIKGAYFSIDGIDTSVSANDGLNSLHSGLSNLVKKNFAYTVINENSIRLVGVSPDGEEGFPGKVELTVDYTLTDNNQLILRYRAVTDKPTPINITNHAFFNLNGHDSGSAMTHLLQIDSDFMTQNDVSSTPTGRIIKVENTPFDFQKLTVIQDRIENDDDQLRFGLGYDQNFVLKKTKTFDHEETVFYAAQLVGEKTGILMNTYTSQPGLQLYTANYLKDQPPGKDGASYGARCGVCLETQHFPAAPAYPHFPNVILRPGEIFEETTIYEFI